MQQLYSFPDTLNDILSGKNGGTLVLFSGCFNFGLCAHLADYSNTPELAPCMLSISPHGRETENLPEKCPFDVFLCSIKVWLVVLCVFSG